MHPRAIVLRGEALTCFVTEVCAGCSPELLAERLPALWLEWCDGLIRTRRATARRVDSWGNPFLRVQHGRAARAVGS